jgi:short-subunit dehydrogenase involved in D-alanine esterification of teichoic acids
MGMKLVDNTILITGGGSGIGFALAKKLTERNNTVIICGRDAEKLQQAKTLCPSLTVIPCDIRDDHQVDQLMEILTNRFSKLNILVNNAAVMHEQDFTGQVDTQKMEEEITTNLTSPIKLTARILPMLKNKAHAAIVNVTSAIAYVIHSSSPIYCASKAGLAMFTQALRIQLKHSPVGVFEAVPPPVDTAMCSGDCRKMTPEKTAEEILQAIEHNQKQILIGPAKLYYRLNGLLPALTRKIIGRI